MKMYSYLNVDRGFLQRGLNAMNHTKISIHPCWSAVKFKMAVFTVPAKALACSMTCDPCQPTKVKGYISVFIHVGAGYCKGAESTSVRLQNGWSRCRMIGCICWFPVRVQLRFSVCSGAIITRCWLQLILCLLVF